MNFVHAIVEPAIALALLNDSFGRSSVLSIDADVDGGVAQMPPEVVAAAILMAVVVAAAAVSTLEYFAACFVDLKLIRFAYYHSGQSLAVYYFLVASSCSHFGHENDLKELHEFGPWSPRNWKLP